MQSLTALKTKEKLRGTQEDTFSTINNVGRQTNTKNLSENGNRRASDRIRNEILRNDPEEDAAQGEWMKAFGYAPQASEWEDRKVNGMNPWINTGEGDTMGPESADEVASEESADEGGMA